MLANAARILFAEVDHPDLDTWTHLASQPVQLQMCNVTWIGNVYIQLKKTLIKAVL